MAPAAPLRGAPGHAGNPGGVQAIYPPLRSQVCLRRARKRKGVSIRSLSKLDIVTDDGANVGRVGEVRICDGNTARGRCRNNGAQRDGQAAG